LGISIERAFDKARHTDITTINVPISHNSGPYIRIKQSLNLQYLYACHCTKFFAVAPEADVHMPTHPKWQLCIKWIKYLFEAGTYQTNHNTCALQKMTA